MLGVKLTFDKESTWERKYVIFDLKLDILDLIPLVSAHCASGLCATS